jgi:hypothetical protein
VRVDLNIDIQSKGNAADLVRGAPFSFIVCYSAKDDERDNLHEPMISQIDDRGGGGGAGGGGAICKPLLGGVGDKDAEISDLKLEPLSSKKGYSVIKAWLQSQYDTPPHHSHAVGSGSFIYLWKSPEDAMKGLHERYSHHPDLSENEKLSIARHLSLAHAQQASKYMHLAAIHGAHGNDTQAMQVLVQNLIKKINVLSNDPTHQVQQQQQQQQEHADQLLDSEELKRMLEKVAIITLSNNGYVDYTVNTMKSLRIKVSWFSPFALRS